jgi:hypothetical protein
MGTTLCINRLQCSNRYTTTDSPTTISSQQRITYWAPTGGDSLKTGASSGVKLDHHILVCPKQDLCYPNLSFEQDDFEGKDVAVRRLPVDKWKDC